MQGYITRRPLNTLEKLAASKSIWYSTPADLRDESTTPPGLKGLTTQSAWDMDQVVMEAEAEVEVEPQGLAGYHVGTPWDPLLGGVQTGPSC